MPPLLRMEGIVKLYGRLTAVAGVDLEVRAGEVHALLGENGAGKSTLMNVLYGLTRPDAGRILWQGRPVAFRSPADAAAAGIGMVHQHFMLVEPLTVAENVALGLRSARRPLLDLDRVARLVSDTSAQYGLSVNPNARVADLGVGQRQRVEIIKALCRGSRLLVLDEPTSVLTPPEVEEFLAMLRRLSSQGNAVVFINHKLTEVLAVSHRVSVMRGGHLMGTVPAEGATPEQLAELMLGYRPQSPPRARVTPGPPALVVEGLEAAGADGRPALRGLSFKVCAGEVLGLAGVDGNGQQELVETLCGVHRPIGGRVEMLGQETTGWPPRRLLELGVGRVPGDRHRLGLILDLPVRDNLALCRHWQEPLSRRGWLKPAQLERFASDLIARFRIRVTHPGTRAGQLSGGNQQKVVLARELHTTPRVLIVSNPTRGLDVGAAEQVHGLLRDLCAAGAAILLVSTDLDEVLALSDRVAVLYRGELMGEIPAGTADRWRIGRMMLGQREVPA